MEQMIGNTDLLKRHKIAYLASRTIASLSVLPTLDWAADIAKREDVAIVSGFHSQMEREVLSFLLRGKCGIIFVLSRGQYKRIPQEYASAFEQNRLLFISQDSDSTTRASRERCIKTNAYAAQIADELLFSSLPHNSSLCDIYSQWHQIKTINIILKQSTSK